MFYNYKRYYLIILLAVSDSQNTFRESETAFIIDVGLWGNDSDCGVLRNSVFCKDLSSGKNQLSPEERLTKSNIVPPYV